MRRTSELSLNLALVLVLLISPGTVFGAQPGLAAPSAVSDPSAPPAAQSALMTAVSQGDYPGQLAGATGDIISSRHGPQRTASVEGLPAHAYAPFDERNNREYPCPAGGCEAVAGYVLLKLAPEVVPLQPADPQREGMQPDLTSSTPLNQALAAQGVMRLDPVFPNARPPQPGAMVVTLDGDLLPEPDLTRWQRARLNDKTDAGLALAALKGLPGVDLVEPDYVRKPAGDLGAMDRLAVLQSFTDPLYAQQWHLGAANVPAAWQWLEDQGYAPGGSRDVVVAVIDTGVDYSHPDLAANMWVNATEFAGTPGVDDDGNGYVDDIHGATVVTGQTSGDPQDDHGHGTHVAGIIAAQAGNSIGGVGVAHNVQIMAIKAAQYSGVLAASDIAAGITYAVDKGADVINMSFGGYTRSQVEEDALAVAFGQAVLVAAAGNDDIVNLPCPFGRDMYPAAYNWVLGVMASTQIGELADFSNSDCEPRDSHEYELLAPGVDIWSTLPGGQYAAWAGTSMAAPIVSGIAGLVRTRWPDKNIYSSRFVMGQIASNVTGSAPDAYAAITTSPQPELSYLEHWLFDMPDVAPINDDDGIVDAGETVDLAIVIRNHWGKAEPVTVTLEAWAESAGAPDPFVTMITDTVSYGAIGSFSWDDNGLIYVEDTIVGVAEPFRFTTDPNTPNDHVIPFRLTMTARNGYDLSDPTVYSFVSRFYLIVQRGVELPRIISEDLVLTKDYYWLVPSATLIEAGVTVTMTEGTQVQFWSSDPAIAYGGTYLDPFLQVNGRLVITGTLDEPVELFPSSLYAGYPVDIRSGIGGFTEMHYVETVNPVLGYMLWPDSSASDQILNTIDHGRFTQDVVNGVLKRHPYGDMIWMAPTVNASSVSHSSFHNLGTSIHPFDPNFDFEVRNASVSLFDSCNIQKALRYESPPDTPYVENSVFLRNFKDFDMVSKVCGWGAAIYDPDPGDLVPAFQNNAILNVWWDPNPDHWMQFSVPENAFGPDWSFDIAENYWGTTSATLIDAAIVDYYDGLFDSARITYQPILTAPITTTYPFVVDVVLSTSADPDASLVGAEPVTFTVTFNRDMDTGVQPQVTFGPAEPYTDFTISGDWTDALTWQGTYTMTPVTGDGYQLMRVADAVAADDAWLVTGDDVGRFRFEIETSGTAAMNLQATGGEGYVDLTWTQTDFDLLAGFNLYRATALDGTYTRLNASILPPDQRDYRDTGVTPGVPYYYRFTVVKTDMTESDVSNTATATPLDTIAPVVVHSPVASAPPGLPLTLNADVTDNVAVQSVTLYHRALGGSTYSSRAMAPTTGDRYAATLEGSLSVSPGVEYYIEATDGVNIARSGRPDYPHQVVVQDRPVVTTVTPNSGPAGGGTPVTLAGSNFKAGATVSFGGSACDDVSVMSTSQITCTTTAHFPAIVDVTVTNPDSQSGALLGGFTYQADTASLGLPHTGGGQHTLVQVPVNLANVDGLAAASVTVTFSPTVLSAQGAAAGNLTPGWSLVANIDTAGKIRLSMASDGGTVSGSGELAVITFDVVGAASTSTVLRPQEISLNDGAIPVESADGSFTVDEVYSISGTVGYWNGGVVSGTLLTLSGDRLYTAHSNAAGAYAVTQVHADDYVLTPSKSDDVNGITAYDASLALQHDAGLSTLTSYAFTAADVNGSSAVTAMDAFYMLQKAAGLIDVPFEGAGRVWDFDPQSRAYTNLSSNLSGQDFTAVLLGDPSGSWVPSGAMAAAVLNDAAVVRVEDARPDAAGIVTTTVSLDPQGGAVYGIDLVIGYDVAAITPQTVTLGSLTEDWLSAANLSVPGEMRVSLAGALPLTESGAVLTLQLELVEGVQETTIEANSGELNEGAIPVTLVDGHVGGQQAVYLPLVVNGFGGTKATVSAPYPLEPPRDPLWSR